MTDSPEFLKKVQDKLNLLKAEGITVKEDKVPRIPMFDGEVRHTENKGNWQWKQEDVEQRRMKDHLKRIYKDDPHWICPAHPINLHHVRVKTTL